MDSLPSRTSYPQTAHRYSYAFSTRRCSASKPDPHRHELRPMAGGAPRVANPHLAPPPVERRHAQAGALTELPHAPATRLLPPKLLAIELLTTVGRRSLGSRHAGALRNGEKHQHN